MLRKSSLPKSDTRLIQIVDKALAENSAKCGAWLACRPGCCQCCIGVFAISQLDAARLREGLARLGATDLPRATAVRKRAKDSRQRLKPEFPGNPQTGSLSADDDAFDDFGNDEPCPALDPTTGLCDLYESRPMTCRVFGPPVRSEGGLGVCELCFQGAPEKHIAACELVADPDDLESRVTREYEEKSGRRGSTIVAWALTDPA